MEPTSIEVARQRRQQAEQPELPEDDLVERLRQIAGFDASVWDEEGIEDASSS